MKSFSKPKNGHRIFTDVEAVNSEERIRPVMAGVPLAGASP